MCALYSRKKDATRSSDQSSGVGDGEVRRQRRGLERTRRVAVGHRDSAVDLGHHDDLDRGVRHADELVRPDELCAVGHRPLAQIDDRLVVDVTLAGQPVEHPAHLTLGVATGIEPRRRLRDGVLDVRQVGLGAAEHRIGGGGGVQRE